MILLRCCTLPCPMGHNLGSKRLILARDIRSRSWPNTYRWLVRYLESRWTCSQQNIVGMPINGCDCRSDWFLDVLCNPPIMFLFKKKHKNILENILFLNPKPGEIWTRLEPKFVRSSPYYDRVFWPRIMKTQNFRLGSGFFGVFCLLYLFKVANRNKSSSGSNGELVFLRTPFDTSCRPINPEIWE